MINIQKGETFEVDPEKDGQEIYGALQNGQITIVDEKYVPKKGRYCGTHNFSELNLDGKLLKIAPGEFVTLEQADATRLLIHGFVRPEADSAWTPQRLLTGDVSRTPAKRMFDEVELSGKENWVTAPHRVKGGTE